MRSWFPWVAGVLGALAWFARARGVELSAWTGLSAVQNPARAIATARAAGLKRLAVFVNDSSFTSGPWRTYDPAAIVACAQAIRAAGLSVTLVSWLAPHWVPALGAFGALGRSAGATELEFDAEEPWTLAMRPQSDATIARVAREAFDNVRGGGWGSRRLTVDCIVGADLRLVGPLVELSNGVFPQAYRVTANANLIDRIERLAVEKYRPFGKPVGLGVAAYQQSKPFLGGEPATVATALETGRALGVREFRFWRLEFLTPELQTVSASFASGDRRAVARTS